MLDILELDIVSIEFILKLSLIPISDSTPKTPPIGFVSKLMEALFRKTEPY